MSEQSKFDFTDLTYLIPVHNEESQIGDCLRSIRAEEQKSKIIVIDDHSTDLTKQMALNFNAGNIEIVESHGRGIAEALNTGLRLSKTRFCVRLDADDRNLKYRGEILLNSLNSGTTTILFTRAQIKPHTSSLRRPRYFGITKEKNLKWLLLISNVVLHPSVCIDRDSEFSDINYPNERGVEDYLLWIQILMAGGQFKYIDRNTIIYNRTTSAASSLRSRAATPLSETSIESFMKFQSSMLGKSDKTCAEMALSGGAFCSSIGRVLIHYLSIIMRAPLRAKPNLLHNCVLMILKSMLFQSIPNQGSGRISTNS